MRASIRSAAPLRHSGLRRFEYANPDFDDSEWADISIGQAWENQGYVQYDEGAWYRTRIEVDAEKGRPVHLAFGGVDKDAYVYAQRPLGRVSITSGTHP